MSKGKFRVKWKGLNEAISGLRDLPKVLNEEVKQAENDQAKRIFERSQELVPVQTGRLKASGKVEGNKVTYDAPYAAEVHEDVAAFHNDGQAKFVESAVNESKPEIDKAMTQAVENSFARTVKK